jgi:hypothetical protein
MQIESRAKERDLAPPSVGSEELAEGLMLVRASTLKVVRFQLAMERHDRRVALEAVDDLVAIDRRLQAYLADVPAAAEQLLFRDLLDAERNLLNHEKLALVAEVVRREPEPAVAEAPIAAEPDLSEAIAWDDVDFAPSDEPGPHRSMLWLSITLALLAALAAAAWTIAGPDALASLAKQGEMLR